MKKSAENYRLICILDSHHNLEYLHIHAVKTKYLKPIEDFAKKIANKPSNKVLYQWGVIEDLQNHNRSVKVLASEIKKFGNVGIGSLWRGDEKNGGIGGGEGFLFEDCNLRIIKGNKIIEVADEDGYWTFQVADFNGAEIFSDLFEREVKGREALKKLLLEKSQNKAFVASFDVEFLGEFFARSNGIFPKDEKSSMSLFIDEIEGGHLLGGSDNVGDIKSLRINFAESKIDEIDFAFIIKTPVLLQCVEEVKVLSK